MAQIVRRMYCHTCEAERKAVSEGANHLLHLVLTLLTLGLWALVWGLQHDKAKRGFRCDTCGAPIAYKVVQAQKPLLERDTSRAVMAVLGALLFAYCAYSARPKPEPVSTFVHVVQVGAGRLRANTTTDSEHVGTVHSGQFIEILDQNSGWGRLATFGSDEAWIRMDLVTPAARSEVKELRSRGESFVVDLRTR